MAGVGEEGAGVGEHAHEAAEHADVGQGPHLGLHAVQVVVEPPGRAELELPGGGSILEGAGAGHQLVVVGGVKGVEDGLGQGVLHGQPVQHSGQGGGRDAVADGVAAHVGPQGLEAAGVQVAQGPQVELHGEAARGVLLAQEVHEQGLVGRRLLGQGGLPSQGLAHGLAGSLLVPDGEVGGAEGLVGQAAAAGDEIVQPLPEGGLHVVQGADVDPGGGAQLLHVGGILGVFHVEGLVGTEGGEHLGGEVLVGGQEPVVLQVVGGIVGGAQGLHAALGDQGPGRTGAALELLIGLLPDGVRASGVQQLVHAEKAQQLQVGPVVDGISDELGHNSGKAVKLLPEGGGAGDVLLGHAAGPHDPPLVVVAGQPRFADVGELLVLIDLLGIEVAVVVEDGHVRGVLVIQTARGLTGEQEVVGEEGFHIAVPFQA